MKNGNRKHGDRVMTPNGPGTIVDWKWYITTLDSKSKVDLVQRNIDYNKRVDDSHSYLVSFDRKNRTDPAKHPSMEALPWLYYPEHLVTDLPVDNVPDCVFNADKSIRYFLSADETDYIELGSITDILNHKCDDCDVFNDKDCSRYVTLTNKSPTFLCKEHYDEWYMDRHWDCASLPENEEGIFDQDCHRHDGESRLIVDTYGFYPHH